MRALLVGLVVGLTLLFTRGCQRGDETGRIAVFGAVTSKSGGPVNGTISFLPEAETKGPAATASLVNGAFKFNTENGPVAGRHRVLVVMTPAESKRTAAFIPASGQTAPAAAPPDAREASDHEWSFDAEVSRDHVKFEFQGPPAADKPAG